jgi:ribosomal protein S18 acetylase RimI-like enzyme
VVLIRPARPGDAAAIAAVRARSWQAAYAGIIPADVLAEWTGQQIVAQNASSIAAERWRIMIIAEAADGAPAAGQIVGFAASGPERAKGGPSAVTAGARETPAAGTGARETPAVGARAPEATGQAVGIELYAIYVAPAHWSSGAGRALLTEAVERARSAGFVRMSLWVLEANARARRFYERAGFTATGQRLVSPELGDVAQVRYQRTIS